MVVNDYDFLNTHISFNELAVFAQGNRLNDRCFYFSPHGTLTEFEYQIGKWFGQNSKEGECKVG